MAKRPDRRDATTPREEDRIDAGEIAQGWLDRSRPPEPEPERPAWQERKAQRDAERVRLRLDVPEWLRADIEQQADAQGMSWSQFAGFLLAYGLQAWHAGDPDMRARFEACKTRIASLRWQYGADLTDFETERKKGHD